MNKIQIRAEILTLITKLQTTTAVSDEMFAVLDAEADKQSIMDVLLKELSRAKEQKAFVICYILTRLFDKETLITNLREFIRDRKISDYAKLIAFNLLKDLGSEVQYDDVNGYFTEFDRIVEEETKEMLNSALMNPEAQIDFIDFLSALSPDDQLVLVKSLNEDYTQDALANILIPLFLYNPKTDLAKEVITLLSSSKSQLAFHAFEEAKDFVSEDLIPLLNKGLSALKLSGIRVDKAVDFYKNILKSSEPYKSYMSYPDGHGNLAVVFTRIRPDDTIQFVAMVLNDMYGILDCFGFNEITKMDLNKILAKFYAQDSGVEVNHSVVKYLVDRAEKLARYNKDLVPYEYVCWKNTLLDIVPEKPDCKLEFIELSKNDIDELCLNDVVQSWFYDENTSETFKNIINKLNEIYINNDFNADLEKFISNNYDDIYTPEEIEIWKNRFYLTAYLKQLKKENKLAEMFYSIGNNKAFLANILRKSIYEYYVAHRWKLKNAAKTTNMFQKEQKPAVEFELMQLDMIISTIEAKWVCQDA
ncbi:MAG: hypothetical protein LUB59_06525 [Candidatus Gastranaerophilales bacterium]|nr:hypothetical protein [Candidatus Gastranaerophilales bacterium]